MSISNGQLEIGTKISEKASRESSKVVRCAGRSKENATDFLFHGHAVPRRAFLQSLIESVIDIPDGKTASHREILA